MNTERNTDILQSKSLFKVLSIFFYNFKFIRFALFFFTFISVFGFFFHSVPFPYFHFCESLLVSLIRSTQIWYVFIFWTKVCWCSVFICQRHKLFTVQVWFVFWLIFLLNFCFECPTWIAQLLCNDSGHWVLLTLNKSIPILTFSTCKTILTLWLLGKPNQKIPLRAMEFPIRIAHRILMAIKLKNSWNAKEWIPFNNQQSVHSTLKFKKSFIEYYSKCSRSVSNIQW